MYKRWRNLIRTERRSSVFLFYWYVSYLRTFAPIVSAHPYCARNSHATSCIERARWVVKWTIIGQMAIVISLRGFNDLGRSVTPIFLSLGRFLYRFSTFCEKIYRVEVLIFCKTLYRIPFIWPLDLAARQFQMPLQGLRFVKMMARFEIINATDSLVQNIVRIVCLCWLIFDILT